LKQPYGVLIEGWRYDAVKEPSFTLVSLVGQQNLRFPDADMKIRHHQTAEDGPPVPDDHFFQSIAILFTDRRAAWIAMFHCHSYIWNSRRVKLKSRSNMCDCLQQSVYIAHIVVAR